MDIQTIAILAVGGAILLALVIALAVANYAGENLITVYKKYEKRIVDFNTTLNFAERVSDSEFDGRIQTAIIPGFLTDNYYKNTISLSEGVAGASNVSAFAVCAHELGHAMQYRDTPQKMKKFTHKLVFCTIVSKLALPIFLVAIPFAFFNIWIAIGILAGGLFCFFSGLIAKLSTIKIEKEASENAIVLLRKYADFDEDSCKVARKVLSAAKLTYIASFLKSVLSWTFLVNKYDFY